MKKLTYVISASLLLSLSGAVLANGEQVFQKSCQACHATGAAGAPKMGDKDAWAPRIATGMDALVANSIKGKGVMPPKGGCAGCSDADMKAAVEYMVNQSK